MKKKLIILVLFILGCSTDPEDCAGVSGGFAEFDNCNICDTDKTNDCVQDCNGAWGGEALYDECKETWELIQNDIFTPQCVSCHKSGTYFAQLSGLVLTADSAYLQLIDVPNTNIYANNEGYVRVSSDGGISGLNFQFFMGKNKCT